MDLPSGNQTWLAGKSPWPKWRFQWKNHLSIGDFPAIFDYQRVFPTNIKKGVDISRTNWFTTLWPANIGIQLANMRVSGRRKALICKKRMYHVHLQEWGWKTWYCSDCSVSISGSGSGGPFFAESNFGTATDLEPWSPGTLQPPVGLQSWVNGRLLVDGDFTIKATSSHGDLTVSWISGSIVFSTVLSFSKSNITWNCCFNNICITLKYVFF